jgi:carboxypeptidase T
VPLDILYYYKTKSPSLICSGGTMPHSFRLALTVSLLILSSAAFATENSRSLVRIDVSTTAGHEFVQNNRGALDVIMAKPGHYVEIAATEKSLSFLRESGHPFEVTQENLEAHLAYRNKGAGFGIFHTRSESIAFIDSLHNNYPNVVSAKWSLGLSLEGRDIYCFRVSANPEVDENEPEILIDGMHHSREIMASEFPIMFAEYLAVNYGTDPEITWLLDNRELYIVPIVNPDGFVYNEVNNPNGGGLWRKNRRDNGNGSFGVDLNRNYPFQWGFDNTGSSPDPFSDTYRGLSPASEPELQVMMDFVNGREIRTHDSVHSYSNLTLIPWSYINEATPDGAIFELMAAEMTKFNGYTPGRPGDILYSVNGGGLDWFYGDETKHTGVFSFSNEIGGSTDGFWPAESRRQPLFEENIWPHIYLMQVAGSWVKPHTPVVVNAVKSVLPGQSAELSFTVENQSIFESILGVDLTVKTDDSWVQFDEATRSIGALASLGSTDLLNNPIPFSVDASCPNGHQVTVMVTMHLAEGDLSFPLVFTVGTDVPIADDDFEGGAAAWALTGSWGISSSNAHTGTQSLTDSPGGDYTDYQTTSATLIAPVQASRLQFWHRYEIETGYDFGRVQVGVNGSWTTVISYTGNELAWQFADLDLSTYAGQAVQVRFLFESDQTVVEDGWYIDDVVILGDPSMGAPAAPNLASPLAGTAIADQSNLVVDDAGTLFYGFRVYSDDLCTQLVASVDDVPSGGAQTSWTLPSLTAGQYYWRAWAGGGGGGERSALTPAEPFTIGSPSGVEDLNVDLFGLRVLDGVTGSQARLQLTLPGQQDVTVEIYDLRGARIQSLHTGPLAGGTRVMVWNGADADGRSVSSGVYLVRMSNGQEARTGRVVIVR